MGESVWKLTRSLILVNAQEDMIQSFVQVLTFSYPRYKPTFVKKAKPMTIKLHNIKKNKSYFRI